MDWQAAARGQLVSRRVAWVGWGGVNIAEHVIRGQRNLVISEPTMSSFPDTADKRQSEPQERGGLIQRASTDRERMSWTTEQRTTEGFHGGNTDLLQQANPSVARGFSLSDSLAPVECGTGQSGPLEPTIRCSFESLNVKTFPIRIKLQPFPRLEKRAPTPPMDGWMDGWAVPQVSQYQRQRKKKRSSAPTQPNPIHPSLTRVKVVQNPTTMRW
ncbi:hypothetical protein AXG93_2145s1260 [Marchantia polymorpha subsp. ruderalis]|uniref:Uncharacterized protein n=1 Tax=Marchantia polymorpha subsp. ruderalis TaxID=1480154 RepID=A0A176VYH6_MARPO|nr:hypothetical protein AXG93_2145s1260 [Marchantia polymorpha subsp. ruderalis]